jgi:pimeloyl-ACP methyl ester carboxylesterase
MPSATAPEALEVAGADGHPIRVWRKGPANGKPIILLHGRTWSARPVWDLQCGEPARDGASELGTSTMDLLAAQGYQSWAPDVRGMGGTARDAQGWTTPDTTVADVKAVLDMMKAEGIEQPPLIGWSQGALIAQMVAQKYPNSISHVVLYASIYDPDLTHPAPAAGAPGLLSEQPPHVDNTWEGAMEDWTVPGLIDDEAAESFGHTGLQWDARKVSWNALDEFNVLDPTKVTIPTLVIHGAKDVYTTMDKQAALFKGIANENKAWQVIPGADHPVHLYPKQRKQWLDTCLSFIEDRK